AGRTPRTARTKVPAQPATEAEPSALDPAKTPPATGGAHAGSPGTPAEKAVAKATRAKAAPAKATKASGAALNGAPAKATRAKAAGPEPGEAPAPGKRG